MSHEKYMYSKLGFVVGFGNESIPSSSYSYKGETEREREVLNTGSNR